MRMRQIGKRKERKKKGGWKDHESRVNYSDRQAKRHVTEKRILFPDVPRAADRAAVSERLDAAVATPIDSLYFLTIQSDKVGELRFEMNGETYVPVCGSINYSADAHHGSLKAPIMLRKDDEVGVYKIIENDHVIIIRNGERYDITGKKL